MTGNVIISEVHAHMYVIQSKEEKHVPYGELVGITLQMRCHTNQGYYN